MVETLSSCEGHPELPYWWEDSGGTAYVLCWVTRPDEWSRLLHRLQQLAQDWEHVQLIIGYEREQSEQWLGFQVIHFQPESARKILDQAISQTTDLIKQEVFAIASTPRWDVPVE